MVHEDAVGVEEEAEAEEGDMVEDEDTIIKADITVITIVADKEAVVVAVSVMDLGSNLKMEMQ